MSRRRGPGTSGELLGRLVGDRLVSVSFVLDDYVQLQFDEASMNIEVFPQVFYAGRLWRDEDLGYADAFRRLGGHEVIATSGRSGDGLRIGLDNGEIHINPGRDEAVVEIASLRVGDSRWDSWRPGEGPFEHLA